MHSKFIYSLFLFFLLHATAVSAPLGNNKFFNVHRYGFVDSSNHLTFEESRKASYQFSDNHKIVLSPKYSYWFRFVVYPKIALTHANIIIGSRHYSCIDFYYMNDKDSVNHQKGGKNIPYDQRTYQLSVVAFSVPMINDSVVFYIKFQSDSFLADGGNINLRMPDTFFNQNISDSLYYGFFMGLALLAAFYSFIFYIRIKEKTFLFYSLYVLSLVTFAAVAWGFVLRPMSYFNLQWFDDYYTIPYSLVTIFLLLYARSFLNAKVSLPVFNKIILAAVTIKVVVYFIGLLTSYKWFYHANIDTLLLSTAFIASLVSLNKGFKPARYLALAFGVLLVGFMFHSFRYLIQNKTFPTVITVYNTGMIEIILFSLALAHRFKTLKDEKENSHQQTIAALLENQRLKDTINMDLEQKVKERTAALEEANNKIAEMNIVLQYDNKKLSSDVKKISQKRVMQSIVTFEEFKEIFPHDESCSKYLEKMKWEKGFLCKKCDNIKYSIGTSAYSRRCSRCNYIETLTSGTLFANLKFPLHKAFYLVFLVSSGKYLSIDEISGMIDLRRQTCWLFKKKIDAVIDSVKIKKKKSSWTDIILKEQEI